MIARCGLLWHASQGRQLHGPGPGCPDDRDGTAKQVAAQLRTAFREAPVDEADRSRVVSRFESSFEPSGQDRGERGMKTVFSLLAKRLDGSTRPRRSDRGRG